jgi:hypothetical protein
MKEAIKVEVIALNDSHHNILEIISEMHNRGDDKRMGIVESVNLYTRQIKKAPLYGNDIVKGMIFQSHQN